MAYLEGLLDGVAVGPVVLVLGAGVHDGASVRGAVLGDGAVEHRDLGEEVQDVARYPLLRVLPCQSAAPFPRGRAGQEGRQGNPLGA